ncbi:MAG: hypothetical protein HYR55_06670 [Acidobacteria bacterium]|nr:hypothetical protein [Acidobacteriota bacterium]MBI3657374.1 hypothetical protein [Acidobacteriota bacterium]
MSVRLKFVKGAHLSTYNSLTKINSPTVPKHVVKVHQLLRIRSINKSSPGQPTFDLKMADLSSINSVVITPGGQPPCNNDMTSFDQLPYDELLTQTPPATVVPIEVYGGNFSYRSNPLALPNYAGKSKPVGWIQVDFPSGPITVQLTSTSGIGGGTYTVQNGQAFDIASYVMYNLEACAIDEEPAGAGVAAVAGSFAALEGGDGQSGNST